VIYVGTSGFSYDDWVGPYYPADLPKKDWLTFYAKEFNALEINFTYYRLPNARTLEGMAKKVPRGFLFTVKATQEMTHARDADAALFFQFHHALLPLIEAKKFGGVLAQFPASFRNTAASADYLRQFRERLADLPVVIELRHAEWLQEETFARLRELALPPRTRRSRRREDFFSSVFHKSSPRGIIETQLVRGTQRRFC
jgi:uncharacterized protein YecE (DUF72 family)